LSQAKLLAWYGKKQKLTQQSKHSPIKRNLLQHKINTRKLKTNAFYGIRPGNGAGLFSKVNISKGGDKKEKSEEKKVKWGSIRHKQANNMIYSAESLNVTQGHRERKCAENYNK